MNETQDRDGWHKLKKAPSSVWTQALDDDDIRFYVFIELCLLFIIKQALLFLGHRQVTVFCAKTRVTDSGSTSISSDPYLLS